MKVIRSGWRILILLAMLLVSVGVSPAEAKAAADIDSLLETMTTEEKVGQLFLTTFNGSEIDQESEIYELITKYHIGGVVLSAENNNFTDEDTINQAQAMIQSLQQIEWDYSVSGSTSGSGTDAYIPLLIGLRQIGNGYPGDQIFSGLTPYPSQMAIGATWDLELANQMGEMIGMELSTLGFNLYLGPNLDVLETANSEAASSLGVNTYGGDPFWVGEMGKSFISGLHTGSQSRMLVVAQNFPGTGSSDRSPELEVSTVRKSLEQLKQIELAPYFAVTNLGVDDPGRTDAVMVSHIRYQGFQGNIRATTKPISFDSNALQQIMALTQFATWRENGGLVISDDLGSGSVRRFFDPNGINFDAPTIARNAFLAGNDILYSDDLISTGDLDKFTTLVSILDFFVQKYDEDEAFAQRVDSSVSRILSAKINLYSEFAIQNVNNAAANLENVGQSQAVTFDVAQQAVTLINPSAQELDAVLPSAPLRYDNIVIFTDVRMVRQCDSCAITTNVSTNGLANALVRVYGPQASGQIYQQNLASYTFLQLTDLLNTVDSETTDQVSESLAAADWVIFNTLEINEDYPESTALQRILNQRSELLSGKNVVVFTLDSPNYLDATNISKVTAYFALYSKTPSFLEVAARILMKEMDPAGDLPVSLNAVGYDLITVTSPDPNQVIGLELLLPESSQEVIVEDNLESTPVTTPTPQPTVLPSFLIGDTLTIRTRPIVDHNQNIVPDGTIVRFNFLISGEPEIMQQFETTTTAGIAYFNYRIEAAGGLEITATSEPATQSEMLQINISPEGLTSIIQISPTPLITETPTATPVWTPTYQPTPTPIPEPETKDFPSLGDWALGVFVILVGGGMAFMIGYLWWGSLRWGLRSALCSTIGSLVAYSYLNLGGDSTKFWMNKSGTGFVVEVIVVGLFIGWIGALIWWMRTDGRYPPRRRG